MKWAASRSAARRRPLAGVPPAAELEHARRHVARLYDIMRLLARFDGIDVSLPAVLDVASEAIGVRAAVVIDGAGGDPRTTSFEALGLTSSESEELRRGARAHYAYLARSRPCDGWVGRGAGDDDTRTMLAGLDRRRTRLGWSVTLPLSLEGDAVFGVLRVGCRDDVDEVDLAFLNGLANQTAVAIARHHERRAEIVRRRQAEAIARAREALIVRQQEALTSALDAVTARDAVISAASHELKNPLSVLTMQLSLLLRNPLRDTLESRLASAKGQVDHMSRLVDNLLDVARVIGGRLDLQPEPTDLAQVARTVVVRAEDDLRRAGCILRLDVEAPVVGRWDRGRIDQVVTNLLSNAIKYGKGAPIEVTVTESGGVAFLSVRDHGIGIAVEDQARIFERFERAADRRAFAGLGLGLWIVRQIVEASGGRIGVTSRPGEGSTFTLELPLESPEIDLG